MANSVVTGGCGFIGSHLVDALVRRGDQVVVIDNLAPPTHDIRRYPKQHLPAYANKGAKYKIGTILDDKNLAEALEGAENIYHLAAFADYHRDLSRFIRTNVMGTQLIFDYVRRYLTSVKHIVVASSQAIAGHGPGNGLTGQRIPDTFSSPLSFYGFSKDLQERLAIRMGKECGVPVTCLRFSIVLGARQSPTNLYSGALRNFAMAFKHGHAPLIFEDGAQTRDFVHVDDVVEALLLAGAEDSNPQHVYNIGGDRSVTVNHLAITVAKEFGIDYTPKPSRICRPGDPRSLRSDIAAATALLGWTPKKTCEQGVHDYCEWLKYESTDYANCEKAVSEMAALGVLRYPCEEVTV